MITTLNLDEKVLEKVKNLHAYHGYKSVSALVNKLLTDWVDEQK